MDKRVVQVIVLLTFGLVCTGAEPIDPHTRISSTGEISPPASTIPEAVLYKDDVVRSVDAQGNVILYQKASPPNQQP